MLGGPFTIGHTVNEKGDQWPGFFVISLPTGLERSALSVVANSGEAGSATGTGPADVSSPPQGSAESDANAIEIVFCLESDYTPLIYTFSTASVPTQPEPPGAPFVMLASDEVMSVSFVPSVDNGGAPLSEFEVVMRDEEIKGPFKTVFTGPLSAASPPVVTIDRQQFSGLAENRAYQLKVRAKNVPAGWSDWSAIGIGRTTDLCDLTFTCMGGNALVLDWSACDPRNDNGAEEGSSNQDFSNLVFQLLELEYPEHLANQEHAVDTGASSYSAVALYEGTSLRFTRWDLEEKAVVRRYRVRFMKREDQGGLTDMGIYSSYLRVAADSVDTADLTTSLVHTAEGLTCTRATEVIGSGTYGVNKARECSSRRSELTRACSSSSPDLIWSATQTR
jgi:hypothetical protein